MALLAVLVLAGLSHEATHWLILRRSGTRIRPAILSPSPRLVLSLGLGWSYEPSLVSRQLRGLSYLWAPLVELAVWLGGAIFLQLVLRMGADAFASLVIGVGMFIGNWMLPHGDGTGWRRVREEVVAARAIGVVSGWPTASRSAADPGVAEVPTIAVSGQPRHWPGVRRHDPSGTTSAPTARH